MFVGEMVNLITKAKEYWLTFREYDISDKLYGVGFFVILICVFVMSISIIFFKSQYLHQITDILISPTFYIFSIAVVLEFRVIVSSLLKKKWVKWFGGVLAILIYKYSEAYSDRFINNFVENEPSYFPAAKSILSALYVPYSWLSLISLLLALFVLIHWIFYPFESKGSVQFGGWKRIARLLGLMWVMIYASQAKFFFEDKESLFTSIAKAVVLYSEYHEKSHCKNVRENELSAYLDRGLISIYSKRDGKFRTESCILDGKNKHNKAFKSDS